MSKVGTRNYQLTVTASCSLCGESRKCNPRQAPMWLKLHIKTKHPWANLNDEIQDIKASMILPPAICMGTKDEYSFERKKHIKL